MGGSLSRGGAWISAAIQAGLVIALVLDTARMRRRLAALQTLPPGATAPDGADPHGGTRPPGPAPAAEHLRLLAAEQVGVDPTTLAHARAHARAQRLDVMDLVPADLPTAQALDLLRAVDPATYRADRLALGTGALHATLAEDGVLRAAGIAPEPPERRSGLGAPALAAAIVQLKLHAPASTDLVVVPGLTRDPAVAARDAEVLAARHGVHTAGALLPQLAWLGTLAVGSLLGRRWALVTLGAWSVQPLAVFAGRRPLRPADLWTYSAARLVWESRRLLAAVRAAQRDNLGRPDPVAQRRPLYQADLAHGVERFFEPRRADCPWCASTRLQPRLRTRDLLQHKPGAFILDRCAGCGHVFQNPRLTMSGLEFYYRDFYDGLGEQVLDGLFRARKAVYRVRAQALREFARPQLWLDVGTGHGHFCNAAREVWPQTTFEGLDMTDGVKLAEHRGWIDRGHRGGFVALSESMTGRFDVVSMFHYLEHTPEPQQELAAARTALRPGGHLLIEVPDPESHWGRLLGKWWIPWLQPQHLNFIPANNLRQRLAELDFTVVAEHRAEVHMPHDLVLAMWTRLSDLTAGGLDLPWYRAEPGRAARLVRHAALTAATPALLAARAGDRILAPLAPRLGLTNAYLMLARRN